MECVPANCVNTLLERKITYKYKYKTYQGNLSSIKTPSDRVVLLLLRHAQGTPPQSTHTVQYSTEYSTLQYSTVYTGGEVPAPRAQGAHPQSTHTVLYIT